MEKTADSSLRAMTERKAKATTDAKVATTAKAEFQLGDGEALERIMTDESHGQQSHGQQSHAPESHAREIHAREIHAGQAGAAVGEKEEKAPIWLLLAALCFFSGIVWYFGLDAVQIADDIRLHFYGVVAREGTCRVFGGKDILDWTFRMSARYTAQDGVSYYKGVHVTMLWPLDRSEACVVRYDAASPARISTSWGYATVLSRGLTAGFFLLVAGFGWMVFAMLLVLTIRDRVRERRRV